MPPPIKTKKMIVKIPRHPYINLQTPILQERMLDDRVRKCRVHVERLSHKGTGTSPSKPKRCIVRVARLPNVDRSEISVTPGSSIVCSDFDDTDSNAE